ncbi:MAG: heme exporter protein CcmD [Pseudomonadota bacterium]
MNHWLYISGAYALTLGASAVLTLWSWRAMRAAERDGK